MKDTIRSRALLGQRVHLLANIIRTVKNELVSIPDKGLSGHSGQSVGCVGEESWLSVQELLDGGADVNFWGRGRPFGQSQQPDKKHPGSRSKGENFDLSLHVSFPEISEEGLVTKIQAKIDLYLNTAFAFCSKGKLQNCSYVFFFFFISP